MKERKLRLAISEGSCEGEEKEFASWVNANYPSIETVIENTLDGGLYDIETEERVDNTDPEYREYWTEYCNQ